MAKATTVNKSQAIRDYLEDNAKAKSKDVVAALEAQGISVTPVLVAQVRVLRRDMIAGCAHVRS